MADQALEPAQFAQLEVHIDSCEHCRRIVAAALSDRSLALGTPVVEEQDAIAKLVDVSINDRYVIKEVLGKGGMGTVYLARDLTLDREVALKLHKVGSGSERLHREAMAMAKLAHPNVVTVFEVATIDDRLYVAMEYVRGETFRGWLRSSKRTWRQIVAMLLDCGTGLAAAHAAGLIHRDFKPENILVGDDGRPRVGDFGLARVGTSPSTTFRRHVPDVSTETAETLPAPTAAAALDTPMTQTGALLGTPAYMAPEQLAGEVVDARCDQFAFCVVMWEALFGSRPFMGGTLTALQLAIDERQLQQPARTEVPHRVRAVLERGLATLPAERFADMPALLAALRVAAAPRTRRRITVAAVSLVAAGGLAGGAAWLVGERRHEAACTAASDEMLRVFDDVERAEMRTAFMATGSPFASSSFERAAGVLERYTKVLARQARTVCEGLDEPARVTAARRACLADRRRELDAFTDILVEPDKAMVQRAAGAAWGMFDPAPCDDVQTLLARATRTATMTPQQSAEIRRVKALDDAGRYEEGIAAAKPLLAAARATGDRSFELDALIALAQLEAEIEAPETGAHFEQAIALAETLGRDLDAAIAYAALANHAGVVTHEYAAAHRFVELARAKLERLGGRNPAIDGDLLVIEAQVLIDENRLGEAESAMQRAVTVIETAYGSDHPKLGAALGTLSQLLRAQRKTRESLAASERTLAVLDRAFGPEHPTVAGAHMNLAQALMDVERWSDAREHLMRADIVFARVFGEVHPMRAAIAGNLGGLEQAQGNWDAALIASRRAVSILEQVQGPDTLDVSGARRDVARELALAGRLDEAVAEQKRAIAILDRVGPEAENRIVSALTELAEYELARNKPAVALPHAERAVALASKRPDDANPAELADARFALARALWDTRGDRVRARKLVGDASTGMVDPEKRKALDAWLAAHPP